MLTKDFLKELIMKAGVDIDKEDIQLDKKFSELGMDSLDTFNFFTEIDAELGVDVPDEDFEELDTLDKVFEYLRVKV
tara:strand:- start:8043 stop:8273 length:231 start_codon:yes stop_codon:yes gene_type:complete